MARDDPVKQCRGVLQQLQKNRAAIVFLHPVDWKALKLPAYPKIVKNPMDLSTVEHKLKSGKYHKVRDFAKDVNQIWQNAHLFNQEGSDIHDWAAQLREEFAGFNSTAPTTRPCAQPCAQPRAPPRAPPPASSPHPPAPPTHHRRHTRRGHSRRRPSTNRDAPPRRQRLPPRARWVGE